jgi:hypothetical protein
MMAAISLLSALFVSFLPSEAPAVVESRATEMPAQARI